MILLLHRCNFERLALVNRKIRALTHTVTHTGKRAYGNNGDKMLRNHSIMSGKAPKAHEISVFGVLTTLRNQQVMCSNHTTSSKTARFLRKTGCFLVLALYLTCAIKIPIFSAACSCICRVAWV